jgi:hypothetical protein
MKRTTTRFAGYDCIKLENDVLALWVIQSAGPRIIGLALQSGDNLFAEVPDVTLDCPGEGACSLRGGHRLWHAPEDPRRTYIPDDTSVTITDAEKGVLVVQPVEAQTGIRKSLTITLPGQDACVIVDHTLHNMGKWLVELAPWAITQLKPGGTAILPQATASADEHGVLPNRRIVLWPYTQINSPHIRWGDRYVFVEVTMQSGALKIGFPNPVGWMAYALENTLFVKHAAYRSKAAYFDGGSSSECYCNSRFLELETLGPRTRLKPGAEVTHREVWTLYPGVSFTPDQAAMQKLADELGLSIEGNKHGLFSGH